MAKRAQKSTRLGVQTLEDRIVPAILAVTGTGDAIAVDGVVTLREAITSANNNANVNVDVVADGDYGADTIRFNIPATDPGHFYYRTDNAAGQVARANVTSTTAADDGDIADIDSDHPHSWFTISPTTALPAFTGPLLIDGYSQAGASPNTNTVDSMLGLNTVARVELDGSVAGADVHGLNIGFGNSEIRGLVINRFTRGGIRLVFSFSGTNNNVIAGNLIGTDVSGMVDLGNGASAGDFFNKSGVVLETAHFNRFGGTAPADRNLISGNGGSGIALGDGSSFNQVQGNLIGTDITGTRNLGNSRSGVENNTNNAVSDSNVIGGVVAGSRNIISGNDFAGIHASTGQANRLTNMLIQGNYIGTDVTGTVAIGNSTPANQAGGIVLGGTLNTLIGGTTAAARNVISGNRARGILDASLSPASSGTRILGNFIGTQADGTSPLGNLTEGVLISGNQSIIGGTGPGEGNVIAFNGDSGVRGFGGTVNVRGNLIFSNIRDGVVVPFGNYPVLDNAIFNNGGLGLDLDGGLQAGVTPNDLGDVDGGPFVPNNLQNFPVLLEVLNTAVDSTIFATLNSLPQTEFLIQFFANDAADPSGHGEGQTLLGETVVRTDSAGNVSFTFDVPVVLAPEQQVTATATRLSDHDSDPNTPSVPIETSEFSRAISGAASILELGQTIEREILLGQELSFRLFVPPGKDARLSAHFADPRIGELLVRVGDLPDVNSFDQRVVAFVNPDPEFLLPGSPAPYFIRIRGTSTANVPFGSFTLTAAEQAPEIDLIAPNLGSNVGVVTTAIVGTGFSAETSFSLAGQGVERFASNVVQANETSFFATFDLTGMPTGSYAVRAVDGLTSSELIDAFTVTNGEAGRLDARLITPSAILRNREATLIVEYENVGETDIPAPLLLIVSDNSFLSFVPPPLTSVGGGSSGGGSVGIIPTGLPPASPKPVEPVAQFLAISRSGPAGVLPPGAKERLELRFQDDGSQLPGFHPSLRFKLLEAGSEEVTFDLASAKDDMRPSTVTPEAWDVIFSNLLARVGTTVGSYVEALRDTANYFSRFGIYTGDLDELLALHFAQADNALPGGSPHAAIDAAAPASGVPLVWGRTFAPTISRRFDSGILGRGWSHPWELDLSRDPETNQVLIRTPGGTRRFSESPDGSFTAFSLDPARLTLANGVFSLREINGTISRFDEATGRLLDVADRNGHSVTLNYVDDRLESLVHSNGDQFSLGYNGFGRLASLTDHASRITTFEYDNTGEHLTSVTGPDGVWLYDYETTPGALHEHALESVTAPDGTHAFYEYDGRGRLIRTSRDGDAEAVTIAYGEAGEVFVTDALDQTTSVFFNGIGQPLEIRDALGRSARFEYDAARMLDRIALPLDTISLYDFDDRGNLTFAVKPDGRSISFQYDSTFNQVLGIRDERGNPIRYSYDDRGNLTSITRADGSRERFTPDADGNVGQSINRRDQAIDYTYDERGQLLRKDHADGSIEQFSYDDRGNLLTAIDESGLTRFSYDEADRLTRVTYSNGRFLEYTYDAGGRRIQLEDQDGFVVKYSYDSAGRISELTDGTDSRLVLYTYDAVGRLRREDNGNGTFTTYEFDDAGQLTSLVNHLPDEAVSSRFDYTYDALGRRTSVTTLEGTTTFGYDAIGQLTSVVLPDGRSIQYQYDAAGNRTAVIDNGVTTTYETNNLNQYLQVGDFARTYDLDGNLITDEAGGGLTFTYDDENRLLSWVDGVLSVGYEYDALGNRTAKVEGGDRTEYLNDPLGLTNVVAEYDADGNLIARYVHGGFGLVSRHDSAGAAAFYDFDALGSTVAMTDSVGVIANHYSYLPFGEALSIQETILNPFEFVGQFGVQQEGNGLDFMRARFYSAGDGRFINEDPISVVGGLNMYRYSANQPTGLVDPDGLIPNLPGVTPPIVTGSSYVLGGAASGTVGQLAIAEPAIASAGAAGAGAGSATAATAGVTTEVVASGVAQGGNNAISIIGRGANVRYLGPARGFISGALMRANLVVTAATTGWIVGRYLDQKYNLGEAPLTYWGGLLADLLDPVDPNANPPAPPGVELKPPTIVEQRASMDPNDIIGPAGFGQDQFLPADSSLFYRIRFENLESATAPAQEVIVTQTLDPDLDFTTFEFLSFGIGESVVTLPARRGAFSFRFDLRPDRNVLLDVTGELNVETGVITWRFKSLDPDTLELPDDPDGGFLPPNQTAPEGEGFVTYIVRPKEGSPTGTRIEAQARIVFDVNEPIDTPAIAHTLDDGAPAASVNTLPERTIGEMVTVSWAGADDTGGSGVAAFDVFVSDNGGPFVPFLLGTTDTSAEFTGQIGHTYEFLAAAIDNVGHRQPLPVDAQAVTTLVAETLQVKDVDFVARNGRIVRIVVSFNQPLSAATAKKLGNYRLFGAGPDRQIGTRDDRLRPLAAAAYDPATNTVRLRPSQPLSNGNFFRLIVKGNAGLKTTTGELLDGDGDTVPGGNFKHIFGRGKELKYFDANGDRVVLRLTDGGAMLLTRDLSGEGLDLVLVNTKAGESTLSGTVRKPNAQTGDGLTTLRSIAGLDGVTNLLTDPPFSIEED